MCLASSTCVVLLTVQHLHCAWQHVTCRIDQTEAEGGDAREGDDAEGIEGVQHATCGGDAVQVVLRARLPAVGERHPDGYGGVAQRHDGGHEADGPQVVEAAHLRGTLSLSQFLEL